MISITVGFIVFYIPVTMFGSYLQSQNPLGIADDDMDYDLMMALFAIIVFVLVFPASLSLAYRLKKKFSDW